MVCGSSVRFSFGMEHVKGIFIPVGIAPYLTGTALRARGSAPSIVEPVRYTDCFTTTSIAA